MALRWIVVLSIAVCTLIFVLPPGWNMLVFVVTLLVGVVLAGVATARRNRRGLPQDWYARHATDRQLEAERQRRSYDEGLNGVG